MKMFPAPNAELQTNPNNRVLVRIWLPKANEQPTTALKAVKKIVTGGEANVGHVSLEIHSQDNELEYASMWPDETENVTNAFKRYKAAFKDLDEDIINEDGKPNYLLCFYSLDISSIKGSFNRVKGTEESS